MRAQSVIGFVLVVLVSLIVGYAIGGLIYAAEGSRFLTEPGQIIRTYDGLVGGLCTIVAGVVAWVAVQDQIWAAAIQQRNRDRRRLADLATVTGARLTLMASVENARQGEIESTPVSPFTIEAEVELTAIDPALAACLPAIANNLQDLRTEQSEMGTSMSHMPEYVAGFQRRARSIAYRCEVASWCFAAAAVMIRQDRPTERPFITSEALAALKDRYGINAGAEPYFDQFAG